MRNLGDIISIEKNANIIVIMVAALFLTMIGHLSLNYDKRTISEIQQILKVDSDDDISMTSHEVKLSPKTRPLAFDEFRKSKWFTQH